MVYFQFVILQFMKRHPYLALCRFFFVFPLLMPSLWSEQQSRSPNVVFVLSDQWRASATGYNGDPNVKTPHLDQLAKESIDFKTAVAVAPVCGPARATILTGQYPLTSGFFLNDITLDQVGPSIADVFAGAGYVTGYIGKWHLDGQGRSNYIPKERRQGFQHFEAIECPPQHNDSVYYRNDDPKPRQSRGYDPFVETQRAMDFIAEQGDDPFFLMLSWNPPHAPYLTAPQRFKDLYDPSQLVLTANVPEKKQDFAGINKWAEANDINGRERVRPLLAGYYAHCSALDHCIGQLQTQLRESELENDTIFVFTSDHGDMLGSHGLWKKQLPYDESIRVPLLLKVPGVEPHQVQRPISHPDLMPTLLGLCGISVPRTVEGSDHSAQIQCGQWGDGAALIANYQPFGQWPLAPHYDGWPASRIGREWRGVRTSRYTYVKDLSGPWLLFDNLTDPHQMKNLVEDRASAGLREKMDEKLEELLQMTNDDFKEGMSYVQKWGYRVDASGTTLYQH